MKGHDGKTPTVSVVIKAYNHAKYVAQTLDSVLAQTFQDFEVIVTDDASTDGTADVIRGFSDPRIKLQVLAENVGLSRAMNATVARAKGKYVAILNSDDYASPDRLLRQVRHLETNPGAGAVFSAVRVVGEEGDEADEETAGLRAAFDIPRSLPDQNRATWLRQFFFHGNCLCAPSATLRRDALLDIGPYDPRLTNLQDLDVWVRLAARWDIHFLTEPLTAFRVRANNQNLSAPRLDSQLRSQFEYYIILRRYLDLDIAMVRDILTDGDGAPIGDETEKKRRLAEAALSVDSPPHRLFGVQTCFDIADTGPAYSRLRDLTGSIDLFGHLRSAARPNAVDRRPVEGVCIVADDLVIAPSEEGGSLRFVLPAATRTAYLASPIRTSEKDSEDQRRLGVIVTAITVHDDSGATRELELEDLANHDGFHEIEYANGARWCWTNGYARLPAAIFANRIGELTLTVAGAFAPPT
jgi:glycosyltransferase involved in cell wall biosynthesis